MALLVLIALTPAPHGLATTGPVPHVSLVRAQSRALYGVAEPGRAAIPAPARLHPALQRALLAQQGPQDEIPAAGREYFPIIVEWRRSSTIATQAATASDRLARREQVVAALQADAQTNSRYLQEMLAAATSEGLARNVRAFWASPVIALEAQPALISSLSTRDDVIQIRLDEPIYLEKTPFQVVSSADVGSGLPWNLQMLNIELAAQGLGLDGTGVVVANLDTGVDWQHPALLKKYRGYRDRGMAVHWGNWHVSTDEPYLYPGDGYGHGTHTMGTILGDDEEGNRIGVAPGARWIAVKIFNNSGFSYESWIHDGFQWILAPEGDPTLAPDVVNNSWGSQTSSDDRFRPDITALRAAGILPIFAAGNDGPASGSIDSPGSLPEALAVGAIDDERTVATFSGRGPSPWGETKPELVAPGVGVISSFSGGGYATGTGTSMAAPHVTGLAALLLQAKPTLTPTQIESILSTTAEPLDTTVPNNATGWGLVNAYSAGLRVTANGELTGRVTRPDGGGIARPAVTAAVRDSGQSVTVSGDATGKFTIALKPGRYDVTARAFGFDPVTQYALEVVSGLQTSTTITLTAQPAGSFFGRVTDLATGAPLTATIAVDGTPVKVQTDANTGLYSLALPGGSYQATVTADAHRIARLAMAVVPGIGQELDAALPAAPRILLIDSGRWYYDSQIRYFEDALGTLDYPYTLRSIRDPFGLLDGNGDRPTLEELVPYDVVIWSAPLDSPGMIEAGDVITGYLKGGGRLLLSGEDIAFWDAGGSPVNRPAPYLTSYLSVWFSDEGSPAKLTGVSGTPFADLTVALNTPDSARQQALPDAVEIRDRLLAGAALRWSPPFDTETGRQGDTEAVTAAPRQRVAVAPKDSPIGATTAGTCRSYRGIWLGFGLEGSGPRPARIETLRRSLDWFAAPPVTYGLRATAGTTPSIGLPGTEVSQTMQVDSVGVNDDILNLQIDGGLWPIELELPDGRHVTDSTSFTLAGCTSSEITATVTIPPGEPRDVRSVYTLRFVSQGDPDQTAAVTITAKTPAPILFVDDERWYNYQDRYIATLNALDLPYDLFDTQTSLGSPVADTLKRYPLVIWTTGYDWYSPLTEEDEAQLGAFLDDGGGLLLSSQDLLDVRGLSDFVRTRLGVAEASLTITSTDVMGLPGSPLGADLGPWRLTYPFSNWSDAVLPDQLARGTLQDEHQNTVGVARSSADWRTAFFSFPLETLNDAARQRLLGRAVVLLSPLGESRLEAPPVAPEGGHIPITLTLGLATSTPGSRGFQTSAASRGLGSAPDDLRAILPIPSGASLVPGSLRGPWQYEPAADGLAWSGSLAAGITLTLGADLALATSIPDGTTMPLRARLYAGDGMTVTAEAPVRIDVPWLELYEHGTPAEAELGGTVQYTLTVTNTGVLAATANLTDTLPVGLAPVLGTAWASHGQAILKGQGLTWAGEVAPGASASIGYHARVTLVRPGARLVNRTELTDDFGRRVVAWATVRVPKRLYFPIMWEQDQ